MHDRRRRFGIGALLAACLFAFAGHARAQDAEPHGHRDPRGNAPSTASSPNEVVQPDEPATDDDATLERATPDPTPRVPEPLQREQDGPVLDVIEQAGVGGPTAFASAGVLEVGGSGSVTVMMPLVMVTLAPFVGWFVYDGLELTFIHQIHAGSTGNGDALFSTLAVIELSGHLRISDRVLAFLGTGPAFLWNGLDAGFALASRLGLDLLVGRSGILRPDLFLTWATADLVDLGGSAIEDARLAWGLELAYSVMF